MPKNEIWKPAFLQRLDEKDAVLVGCVMQALGSAMMGRLGVLIALATVESIPLLWLFTCRYYVNVGAILAIVGWSYYRHRNLDILFSNRKMLHFKRGVAQILGILSGAWATTLLKAGPVSCIQLFLPVCIILSGAPYGRAPTKRQVWLTVVIAPVLMACVMLPEPEFSVTGFAAAFASLFFQTWQYWKFIEVRIDPVTKTRRDESKIVSTFYPLLPATVFITVLNIFPIGKIIPAFAPGDMNIGTKLLEWNGAAWVAMARNAEFTFICVVTTLISLSVAKRCPKREAANYVYVQPLVQIVWYWLALGVAPFVENELQRAGGIGIVVLALSLRSKWAESDEKKGASVSKGLSRSSRPPPPVLGGEGVFAIGEDPTPDDEVNGQTTAPSGEIMVIIPAPSRVPVDLRRGLMFGDPEPDAEAEATDETDEIQAHEKDKR